MPTLNSDTQVELLEGSGVSDGIMTANVKCKFSFVAFLKLTTDDIQARTVTAGQAELQISKPRAEIGYMPISHRGVH